MAAEPVVARQSPMAARPDDAARQAALDAMKRQATGLLALAASVFVGASVLEGRYPWLGYVRAFAEASVVGGLADWFAVTALFRRPLGLPIPHTAIVPTHKDRIGRVLGNFVQNHFLTREVIATHLSAVHPAERAARWLSQPENARQIDRQVAIGLARTLEAVPDDEARERLREAVTARLRAVRVAPALGKTLALAFTDDRHHTLLDEAVRLAAEAVRNNRDAIREQVRVESPWWVPGVVNDRVAERIIATVEHVLRDVSARPEHPLRAAFDAALRDFIDRLQHAPEVIAKAEAIKEEWLTDPAVAELSTRLWEAMREAVVAYATTADRPSPGPLERGLSELGRAVLEKPELLAEIDAWLIDTTAVVVERYRQEIGNLIAQTVAGWDPEATSRRVELAVGRDLQFVRMNGTIVGGLVGLVIYTVSRILA